MRTIEISTDTFAAIWKAQKPGEATEDAILRRVLGVVAEKLEVPGPIADIDQSAALGFMDERYGVRLPQGFRIFRMYRSKEYVAHAENGYLKLATTGGLARSLNELSLQIGAEGENAWTNWFFLDEKGDKRPLSYKRDPKKIVRRIKFV